jgi:hypothetical protein
VIGWAAAADFRCPCCFGYLSTLLLGGLLRAGVSGEDTLVGGLHVCVWGKARWEVPLHVLGTANNVAILPKLPGCGVDPCEVSVNGVLVMGIATWSLLLHA